MSATKRHLLIFERKLSPLDYLGAENARYAEVCKAYASLEPLSGRELQNANQTQAQTTHKISLFYSAATASITPSCRAKLKRPNVVDESDPKSDKNYRVFEIESVVDVREQNRELLVTVVEKV